MTTPRPPFDRTHRVTLELSNRCPLATLHHKCPACLEAKADPRTLPKGIIHEVLYTLRAHDYGEGRTLSWHCYNEPTADPRLFQLIAITRELLPEVSILVWSNAWNADETMVRELYDVGANHLVFTSYNGQRERMRLREYAKMCRKPDQTLRVLLSAPRHLDRRMHQRASQSPPRQVRKVACMAPWADLTIWHTGHIGLCCLDWERSVSFGNLHDKPFLTLLTENAKRMDGVYRDLSHGRRRLPACRACIKKRSHAGSPPPVRVRTVPCGKKVGEI